MIALRKARRASNVEKRSRGFTLVEMLLVTILTATLMTGIWGISSMYLGLLESGKRKTEEAQLVRTLTRIISEDLLSVVQPFDDDESPDVDGLVSTLPSLVPMNSRTANGIFTSSSNDDDAAMQPGEGTLVSISAASALPDFQLLGSERELRMNVLQVVHPDALRHTERYSDTVAKRDFGANQPAASRVPELKTIVYTFQEPRESVPNDRRPPAGLMRRELPWEQTFSSGSAATSGRQSAEFTEDADFALAPFHEAELLESDESVTLIPEVVEIGFRYFDGQAWSHEWDSRARKTLPVAVEVMMRVMSSVERQQLYGARGEPDGVDREPGRVDRESEELGAETAPAVGRVHRKLIFLPAARKPQSEFRRSALGETQFSVTSDPLSGERP